MPAHLYEIVQLPDGDFALQRSDGDGEPLVRIRFSSEAKKFLKDGGSDVAKAMIDAGIEAVEQMSDSASSDDSGSEKEEPRVLH